jgi:hypothetical protein
MVPQQGNVAGQTQADHDHLLHGTGAWVPQWTQYDAGINEEDLI